VQKSASLPQSLSKNYESSPKSFSLPLSYVVVCPFVYHPAAKRRNLLLPLPLPVPDRAIGEIDARL
jgi:hypothetical protein